VSVGADYLERIVPSVRRRLDERRSLVPQAELEAVSGPGGRSSFAVAVSAPGVSLIAEVKRASPSRGSIRPDLDVGRLVGDYAKAGARSVSVLTEQDFFTGCLADLRTAAEHTHLPLLQKDFIFDPYQIFEARAFGASAVLLIAALLDDRQLVDLAGLAVAIGLEVLLEVHDETEMARALAIEGEDVVIGINNRDLASFAVSLDTTVRLSGLVPADRLLVSESGVRTHEDVERLAALGVDAVLVGESLLAQIDVERAIHRLMDPPLSGTVRSSESAGRGGEE
jgi:indole-3-glycerol phosphate synthase